jgi:hypothetical protein
LAEVIKIIGDKHMVTTLTSNQLGILVLRVMSFKCGVTAGNCALLAGITPSWIGTGRSPNEFEAGVLYGIQNGWLVNTQGGFCLTDEGFDQARAEQ